MEDTNSSKRRSAEGHESTPVCFPRTIAAGSWAFIVAALFVTQAAVTLWAEESNANGLGNTRSDDGPGTGAADSEGTADDELRDFRLDAVPYRTLRSGEGFRTTVFGRDVEVPPRDRRRNYAWNLGVVGTAPGADESEVLPVGALYFWYHPDDDTTLRAVTVGVFNEVFYAVSPSGFGPFEAILTFDSFTVPAAQGELIDGQRLDEEELITGYLRPGFGLGFRRQVSPGEQDNMLAISLTGEPGYVYFDDDSDTDPDFREPQDTFEGRIHLQVKWDALIRNLIELPHSGYALGCDLIHGFRSNWDRWGVASSQGRTEEDFTSFTGYAMGATGVPGMGERHRLIGAAFGGVGGDLDRFSAPRVGGGPSPLGEEYGSTSRPILPGAAVEEFFPEHYAIFIGEYRYEPIFFTYVGVRGSVAYLDRDRRRSQGIRRHDDLFGSVGLRLTTGFVGETRLQIDYDYSWSMVRRGSFGGHAIVAQISRQF